MTTSLNTSPALPGAEALKLQAKRLRAGLAEAGTPISHAAALETIARQWGYRDWNTLNAAAASSNHPRLPWTVGQPVSGAYLGHAFTGRLKALRMVQGRYYQITVVFDTAVDVVTSTAFSAFRKQVNATVNAHGISQSATSDGTPHMQLDIA